MLKHTLLLVTEFGKPRVEARQSTDILSIEDESVREAVRFIRQKADKPLQVNDVVNDACVLRRTLERRFNAFLGHTIRVEIERARVAWIQKMLIETNLPLEQIAVIGGFSSQSYMANIFSKVKGIRPLTFRKSFREKPDYDHLL